MRYPIFLFIFGVLGCSSDKDRLPPPGHYVMQVQELDSNDQNTEWARKNPYEFYVNSYRINIQSGLNRAKNWGLLHMSPKIALFGDARPDNVKIADQRAQFNPPPNAERGFWWLDVFRFNVGAKIWFKMQGWTIPQRSPCLEAYIAVFQKIRDPRVKAGNAPDFAPVVLRGENGSSPNINDFTNEAQWHQHNRWYCSQLAKAHAAQRTLEEQKSFAVLLSLNPALERRLEAFTEAEADEIISATAQLRL